VFLEVNIAEEITLQQSPSIVGAHLEKIRKATRPNKCLVCELSSLVNFQVLKGPWVLK
jgi:hypothetical protein